MKLKLFYLSVVFVLLLVGCGNNQEPCQSVVSMNGVATCVMVQETQIGVVDPIITFESFTTPMPEITFQPTIGYVSTIEQTTPESIGTLAPTITALPAPTFAPFTVYASNATVTEGKTLPNGAKTFKVQFDGKEIEVLALGGEIHPLEIQASLEDLDPNEVFVVPADFKESQWLKQYTASGNLFFGQVGDINFFNVTMDFLKQNGYQIQYLKKTDPDSEGQAWSARVVDPVFSKRLFDASHQALNTTVDILYRSGFGPLIQSGYVSFELHGSAITGLSCPEARCDIDIHVSATFPPGEDVSIYYRMFELLAEPTAMMEIYNTSGIKDLNIEGVTIIGTLDDLNGVCFDSVHLTIPFNDDEIVGIVKQYIPNDSCGG